MRAITPVFSVLLIVVLSVALVGFLWLFVTGTFNSLKSTGTSTVNESLTTISSCMKIESVSSNQVSIRNCGAGSIAQSSLGVYLDDIPLNLTMNPPVIGKDNVGIVSLSGLWNFNLGGHTLRIANPRVVAEVPVNAVLPDSCVLDLEFDEGSGTFVKDKSGYKNDGTIVNGEGNEWTKGRFGYALDLDNDYVGVGNDSSLAINNSDFSIEAWIKTPETEKLVTNGDDTRDYFVIARKHVNWNNSMYMFGVWNDTKGVFVRIADIDENVAQLSGKADICDNQWHHVFASVDRDSSTGMKLYVDGVANPTTGNPTSVGSVFNTSQLEIGRTYYFNGTIDSVRIYNQALTPDQTISLRPVSYD